MSAGIKASELLDRYGALCLALCAVILTMSGIGNNIFSGIVGMVICAAGMTYKSARTDYIIFVPLILYCVLSLISALAAGDPLTSGYGVIHLVYPAAYLLLGCLDDSDRELTRRLCLYWAAVVAIEAIVLFTVRAVAFEDPGRASGLLGNPNALGIFLVISWLGAQAYEEEDGLMNYAEPLMLTAAAFTLSFGSFIALAAGIAVLAAYKKKSSSLKGAFGCAFYLFAKAAMATGAGLLAYVCAARTAVPAAMLIVLAYAAFMTAYWKNIKAFFKETPKAALLMAATGIILAIAAASVRQSAAATLAERIDMIKSGARYIWTNPLTGVGPFKWRYLDAADGGTYFNTWHIHNVPVHIAVATGIPAALALAVAVIRYFIKKPRPAEDAAFTAFFIHNLGDTSFFYTGIATQTLLLAADPRGSQVKGAPLKLMFAAMFALFAYALIRGLLS